MDEKHSFVGIANRPGDRLCGVKLGSLFPVGLIPVRCRYALLDREAPKLKNKNQILSPRSAQWSTCTLSKEKPSTSRTNGSDSADVKAAAIDRDPGPRTGETP